MAERYNGWTNYETWCANLHIDNSEPDQNYWRERAEWCLKHQPNADDARYELAEAMKDAMYEKYDEQRPDNGILADLLSAALSEVNWHEIARHHIEAVKEESNA
jgi:hypothetical protein